MKINELDVTSYGDKDNLEDGPRVSFYEAPITNLTPAKEVTIWDVYQKLTLDMDALIATHKLWNLDPADKKARKELKNKAFCYVTFSGTFTIRRTGMLKQHSGLLCIDLDHVESKTAKGKKRWTVWDVKQLLASDPKFETALCFRSPSGDGVKWVVVIDLDKGTHEEWFDAICLYLKDVYGLIVDPTGRDVTRTCYLPYDPLAIIGDQFRKNKKNF